MENGKEVKPATLYADGNPKAAEGAKKVPLHLVPTTAVEAMAQAFKLGAEKYGPYNWREPGKAVSISTYIAAARRHIDAIWEGQDLDPESTAAHAGHAMACMAIIEDARRLGCLIDDRPKVGVHRQAPKDADTDQLSKRIMSPKDWRRLYRAEGLTQTEAQPSEERGYIRIKPGHPTLASSGGRYLVSLVDGVGTWGTRKQARLHRKETFDKFPAYDGKPVIEFLPQDYFSPPTVGSISAEPLRGWEVGLNDWWWRTLRQEGYTPGLPRAVNIGHSAAQELKRSVESEFFPRKSQTGKTSDLADVIGWWSALSEAERELATEEASRQVLPWPRFYFVRAQA